MKKYYHCDNKFWSIDTENNTLTIRYGNLSGFEELNIKKVEKQFPNNDDCLKYYKESI